MFRKIFFFDHCILDCIGSPKIYLIFFPLAALDWGGPRREWFELICKVLFDTTNQLFTRFSDDNQALVGIFLLIVVEIEYLSVSSV